jgi:hypothetical protein
VGKQVEVDWWPAFGKVTGGQHLARLEKFGEHPAAMCGGGHVTDYVMMPSACQHITQLQGT